MLAEQFTRQAVYLGDPIERVSPELEAIHGIPIGRHDLHRITADAEAARSQHGIVALVKDADQVTQQLVALHNLASRQFDHHLPVCLGIAQAIDAGHGGHHDDVPPAEQG